MTVLTRELRASFALVERNFNLTKRYLGWEVAFTVYSVAGALAVTMIGRDQNSARLILALMIGLGVFVFGWAERYAKRTGKLKRVG